MKRLLVVVDMQNDFIGGALAAPNSLRAVRFAKELIEREAERGTEIVYTQDLHGADYLSTREGRHLPVPHAIAGSGGEAIADGLYRAGAKVFKKSVFASAELSRYAQEQAFDEVILCGICTDICVISNALLLRSALPEAEIYVAENACAGSTAERHAQAVEVMKSCQINLI